MSDQRLEEIKARHARATAGPHAEHKYIGWGAGECGLYPAVYFHNDGFSGAYAFGKENDRKTAELTAEENAANYQLALHAWADIKFLLSLLNRPVCKWTLDSEGLWYPACGGQHVFEVGGPLWNKQKFCGYCGGKLEEVIPPEDDDE